MIDLGIIQLPLETINVVLIVTALLLAANYIGYSVIAAVGGLVAVIYGIRGGFYKEEIIINEYSLGVYECWLMVVVGGFCLYRGTSSFFDGKDVNTWK